MTITIYDYNNREVLIDLPDKKITEIFIHILSGDETGWVEFEDGSEVDFDASDCRVMAFDDGCYSVHGEDIQKWIDFKARKGRTASYERQDLFS